MVPSGSANLEYPTCVLPLPAPHEGACGRSGEDAVRSHVRTLLSVLYPSGNVVERRRDARYPFPFLLSLTPLGPQGQSPVGPDIVVAGKQLSEQGLGFYHPTPLAYRRVLATVDGPGGRRLRCIMDIRWCRFTRVGWYESGGRLLEVLPEAAFPPG